MMNARIEGLDLGLFSKIPTQSNAPDWRAWLAIQRVVRRAPTGYCYLEIGSHLGGSLQQHVVDPRCRKIYSIDKRPTVQPDDRGDSVYTPGGFATYPGNSTERMLQNLRPLGDLAKLECIDAATTEIDPARIQDRPEFCLIDGEHTQEAAFRDFLFCLQVAASDAAICFHDCHVVGGAILKAEQHLTALGVPFRSGCLGSGVWPEGVTHLIALRECPVGPDVIRP